MASAGTLIASCGGESGEPIFVDDVVVQRPEPTVVTTPIVPSSTTAPTAVPLSLPVVVERAWSPENAVAELVGFGALATDPVTVDESPAEVRSFEIADDGSFVVRVGIDNEGAHTVCIRDTCSRVYTLAPDAESRDEIEAKITEAESLAAVIFDGPAEFPDWSIVTSGPFSGTGGTTDVDTKTITVHANRGRSVEEFVITILHEWGHVLDSERLDDDERAAFRAARGIDESVEWRDAAAHSIDDWGMQPSEDFAEVAVAWWTAATEAPHQVRTSAPAGQPDAETFALLASFVAT